MADWIMFGYRTSHAPEIAESIWRRGDDLIALIDNLIAPVDHPPEASPVEWAAGAAIVAADALDERQLRAATVIPQTTPGHRYAVAEDAIARGLEIFPPLLDPSAVVGRTVEIARGVVVGAGSTIAALSTLGEFVLVNRRVSIGHHVQIDDYASAGPGCVLAGGVRVGRGAFLGAGAVCAPGVTIGSNATVGVGAVVIRDVADGDVVVGNPARVLRSGTLGFGGVAVP